MKEEKKKVKEQENDCIVYLINTNEKIMDKLKFWRNWNLKVSLIGEKLILF